LGQKECNVSENHGRDEPLARYEITEAAASEKKWTLSLYPDYCRLEPPDGEAHEVDRAEWRERVQTIESGLFLRRVLIVTLAKKRVIFKLSAEAFAAVSAWIGPPTMEDLTFTLKQRFRWVLPLGLLFVLAGLPLADLPWEPVSLGLGLALILTGTLAKLWPHRILFALDSLWFAVLAANAVRLLLQEWSWLRLVQLLAALALVQSGWRAYRRFAPERMAAPEAEPNHGGSDTPRGEI
jgi:hypothetical protein